MTPDLEELIRQRAHEIWEQEGRPHGRHEEHWQSAAREITQELERTKASHTPATAEEIEASTAPRKGRPRRSQGAEPTATPRTRRTSRTASGNGAVGASDAAASGADQQGAPRKRGRKAAGDPQPEAATAAATITRRRAARGAAGAQSEPATDGAPKTRRRKSQATEAAGDSSTLKRPARRGRKPKAEGDVTP